MNKQAEQRPYFPFYRSFRDAIADLPQETKLPIYEAIADFALDGVEPNGEVLGAIGGAMWKLILPNLETSWQKYRCGKQGGAPKGSKNNPQGNNQWITNGKAEDNQWITKGKAEDNQRKSRGKTIIDKDNREIDKDNREIDNNRATPPPQTAKRFSPPFIVEVNNYIKEMGYTNVDAQQFCDYYNSIGWVVGKSPMKDWRSAVRNWERRAKTTGTNTPLKRQNNETNFGHNQKTSLLHFEAGNYGESTI